MSVTRLPVPFRRRRTVDGREVWNQDEPPPEMVWEVCPYLRGCEPCHQCPTWQEDGAGDTIQKGCYGLAAEACRIVFAMQERLTTPGKGDG